MVGGDDRTVHTLVWNGDELEPAYHLVVPDTSSAGRTFACSFAASAGGTVAAAVVGRVGTNTTLDTRIAVALFDVVDGRLVARNAAEPFAYVSSDAFGSATPRVTFRNTPPPTNFLDAALSRGGATMLVVYSSTTAVGVMKFVLDSGATPRPTHFRRLEQLANAVTDKIPLPISSVAVYTQEMWCGVGDADGHFTLWHWTSNDAAIQAFPIELHDAPAPALLANIVTVVDARSNVWIVGGASLDNRFSYYIYRSVGSVSPVKTSVINDAVGAENSRTALFTAAFERHSGRAVVFILRRVNTDTFNLAFNWASQDNTVGFGNLLSVLIQLPSAPFTRRDFLWLRAHPSSSGNSNRIMLLAQVDDFLVRAVFPGSASASTQPCNCNFRVVGRRTAPGRSTTFNVASRTPYTLVAADADFVVDTTTATAATSVAAAISTAAADTVTTAVSAATATATSLGDGPVAVVVPGDDDGGSGGETSPNVGVVAGSAAAGSVLLLLLLCALAAALFALRRRRHRRSTGTTAASTDSDATVTRHRASTAPPTSTLADASEVYSSLSTVQSSVTAGYADYPGSAGATSASSANVYGDGGAAIGAATSGGGYEVAAFGADYATAPSSGAGGEYREFELKR